MKIVALLSAWTLIVYLTGPIVTALVQATAFRASVARMGDLAQHSRYDAAARLLDLYDAHNPPPLVLYQIVPDYCGYGELSDDAEKGYEYLFTASLLTHSRFQRRLRIERFTAVLTDFGAAFLGNCISRTVLARACESYIRRVLDRNGIRYARDLPVKSPDGHEQKVENSVTCRFLDGIAARAGQPLVGVER
jgi:hypothetical protein